MTFSNTIYELIPCLINKDLTYKLQGNPSFSQHHGFDATYWASTAIMFQRKIRIHVHLFKNKKETYTFSIFLQRDKESTTNYLLQSSDTTESVFSYFNSRRHDIRWRYPSASFFFSLSQLSKLYRRIYASADSEVDTQRYWVFPTCNIPQPSSMFFFSFKSWPFSMLSGKSFSLSLFKDLGVYVHLMRKSERKRSKKDWKSRHLHRCGCDGLHFDYTLHQSCYLYSFRAGGHFLTHTHTRQYRWDDNKVKWLDMFSTETIKTRQLPLAWLISAQRAANDSFFPPIKLSVSNRV